MHLSPKQDHIGSNPIRIAEFDANERVYMKTEFCMMVVQTLTTFGLMGYVVGTTIYDKVCR